LKEIGEEAGENVFERFGSRKSGNNRIKERVV
jgi:hypothetical protein